MWDSTIHSWDLPKGSQLIQRHLCMSEVTAQVTTVKYGNNPSEEENVVSNHNEDWS